MKTILKMQLLFTLAISVACGNGTALSTQNHSEHRIENGAITLAARLDLPKGEGPFPAVVVVHGSGKRTRDEAQFITDHLLPLGIAVLRYDKRGVGDSGGAYYGIGPHNSERMFELLASDAIACVNFLRTQQKIDSARIGLIGASQAGWIIPLAALRSAEVKFMVNLVGPVVSVGEEIFYSKLTGDDPGGPGELSEAEIDRRFKNYNGPHGYDPVPILQQVTVPGLWVLGGKDRSLPTAESIVRLEKIKREHKKEFTVHLYANGTHSLRDATTGAQLPVFEEVVNGWILERVRGGTKTQQ